MSAYRCPSCAARRRTPPRRATQRSSSIWTPCAIYWTTVYSAVTVQAQALSQNSVCKCVTAYATVSFLSLPPSGCSGVAWRKSCCGSSRAAPTPTSCRRRTSTYGMGTGAENFWTVVACSIGRRETWGQCTYLCVCVSFMCLCLRVYVCVPLIFSHSATPAPLTLPLP
jgi:hypothetical protein